MLEHKSEEPCFSLFLCSTPTQGPRLANRAPPTRNDEGTTHSRDSFFLMHDTFYLIVDTLWVKRDAFYVNDDAVYLSLDTFFLTRAQATRNVDTFFLIAEVLYLMLEVKSVKRDTFLLNDGGRMEKEEGRWVRRCLSTCNPLGKRTWGRVSKGELEKGMLRGEYYWLQFPPLCKMLRMKYFCRLVRYLSWDNEKLEGCFPLLPVKKE